MSTGAECSFTERKPGFWYYKLQRYPYGETESYDTHGPFSSLARAVDNLYQHHANPGGYSVQPYVSPSTVAPQERSAGAQRYGFRAKAQARGKGRGKGKATPDPRTYLMMSSGTPQQSKSYGSYFTWGVIDSGQAMMPTSRNRGDATHTYVAVRRELRQDSAVTDSTPVWDADAGRFITWLAAVRKDEAAALEAADKVAGNRAKGRRALAPLPQGPVIPRGGTLFSHEEGPLTVWIRRNPRGQAPLFQGKIEDPMAGDVFVQGDSPWQIKEDLLVRLRGDRREVRTMRAVLTGDALGGYRATRHGARAPRGDVKTYWLLTSFDERATYGSDSLVGSKADAHRRAVALFERTGVPVVAYRSGGTVAAFTVGKKVGKKRGSAACRTTKGRFKRCR